MESSITLMEKETPQRPSVLIIDDQISIVEMFVLIFERAGFDVRAFTDGAKALQYVQETTKSPDVILMDINLPGVSGIYLLRYLRQRLQLSKTKIAVVSANSIAMRMPEMKMADAVLSKPCSVEELLSTVNALLKDVVTTS